ncbi:TolC family protein [Terriglobus albidus]|uniref:TolC family protein n=1 Tax=Terriglobus albidus TaxID=1592106 RepID=UPI0021DF6CCD|nr:TolC family protein [Terriglobus albidus]
MHHRRRLLTLSCTPLILYAAIATAQNSANGGTTLSIVVSEAEKNYPSIRVSQEDLNASAARLSLARTAYLPRLDGLAQFNRGTRNNVFGQLLPQAVLPSMSGPVIGTNNGGSVWGSATGLLVNWQPFDFGLRHANVTAATAARDKARATGQRTVLEVAAGSADAYLTELASMSTKTAASAAVQNWETLKTSIHALVAAQLRPGADESRVDAERAAAVTQLALAEEAIETSRATMLKFAPQSGINTPTPGRLQAELPDLSAADASFAPSQNPVVAEQEATVKQNAAQFHAIERSWVPQFNLEAAGYARGTGAETNGQRLTGTNGLAPNVGNYVAGVNISFPFLDFVSIHARESEQAANLRAAKATEDLAVRTLQEQFSQALAGVKAAKTIAENTPIEVKSAQTALDQATARYKAGLAPIDDVAQAQRLLVQAQIDDSVARLNVWRAFLRLQFVRGDLQPFLDQAGR